RAGTVWTSGVNSYGQIGDGTLEDRQGLGVVEGVENIVQIAAGVEHVLVLRNDGAVWAWGRNQRG
ncbi:MAG: RCC1 repeat- and reductase domain-containing protein, partial [Desulfobacterales bacterium]|nr:RCC1 repeat- and reductase domain-containing protein [Desulfobacterales bacterium]